ncbi:hypothetical protein CRUP_033250 [Coryphaenoides rupestris]|nr:hypothetical protein CRUP_033250 [Coryphaenoides rupestris]
MELPDHRTSAGSYGATEPRRWSSSSSRKEIKRKPFINLQGPQCCCVAPTGSSDGVFQNHSRLRTPPLSHSHSPSHQHHHHAASANSLNRSTYTARSNPSPAPTDSSAPPDGPASGATEPGGGGGGGGGGATDNWLLNSNIPLETRNIAKQAFLENLQDNLIEMDVLASAQRDAAYNHGHFLFKPGGTSPMYCTTSPGYPLTSSTVYSPPTRPLPRSTFSRPAFSLKKPYKHCNWKCAALSAILISATLLLLLAYFIAPTTTHQSHQRHLPCLLHHQDFGPGMGMGMGWGLPGPIDCFPGFLLKFNVAESAVTAAAASGVSRCFGSGSGVGLAADRAEDFGFLGPGAVPENSISKMALNHLDVISRTSPRSHGDSHGLTRYPVPDR